MSSTSSTITAPPVKRACDSCHRRKVRCIGEGTNPCKNCISAGLTCTYNAIPQKKGPKGSRAKVLSELRETQRHSHLSAGYPPELGFDGRPLPSSFARTPSLLPPGLVESCIDFFFANLYPSQPILQRQRLQDSVMSMDQNAGSYCMLVGLCAYVMIQSNMSVPPTVPLHPEMAQLPPISLGITLLEETVRVRKGHDYAENPSVTSILTSFFIYGSFFCLDKDNSAWFHLREATTMAQLIGMHDEETYKTTDTLECAYRRRLYWLLFVAERTYALHKHRPVTLHATIHLPSVEEDPAESMTLSGFLQLIDLYKLIDDSFITLWNKTTPSGSGAANPSWLASLQVQLKEMLPAYLDCTEIQAADLRVTQQWLRTVVWQLCVSQGFVSSLATDPGMTFKYPIEISSDLLSMTQHIGQQAMELHGLGLIEKLFDISCCLTDVIAVIPFSPTTFSMGPRDYLSRFVALISTLRNGQTRYAPLLHSKINEVLPNLNIPVPPIHPQPGMQLPSHAQPVSSSTSSTSIPEYKAPPQAHSLPGTGGDLMRQLQSQISAQGGSLRGGGGPSSLLPPSSRIEDMTLYDSSAPHSAHSTSAPASHEATPIPGAGGAGGYDSSPGSSLGHHHHPHTGHHLQPAPHMGAGMQYELSPSMRFQTFGVGTAMGFQEEQAAQQVEQQQGQQGRHVGHRVPQQHGHGGGYQGAGQ